MKTTTKRMTKGEATAEIVAILARVGSGVDLLDLCAEAAELAKRERHLKYLRRVYKRSADQGETWEQFMKEAIELGEWEGEIPPAE